MDKKLHIIIHIFILLVLSSFVSADDLTTNLISYWDMTDCNAPQDSSGNHHLTEVGAVLAVDGIIGQACNLSVGNYFSTSVNIADFNWGTGNFTLSMWVNPNSLLTSRSFFENRKDPAGDDMWGIEVFLTENYVEFHTGAVILLDAEDYPMGLGFSNWVHILVVKNGSNIHLIMNGTVVDSVADSKNYNDEGVVYIGHSVISGGGDDLLGAVDEVATWNRALSNAEIQQIYNSGAGCNPVDNPLGCSGASIPTTTVDLITPEDNNYSEVSSTDFIFNLTYYDPSTCNLFMNISGSWSSEGGNTTPLNNESLNTITASLPNGNYIWNVNCSNGTEDTWGASNFTIDINVTTPPIPSPIVTLYSPENNSIYNTFKHNLTFNASTEYAIINGSLYLDGIYNKSNTTEIINNHNSSFLNIIFPEGTHYWSIKAKDNNTNETMSNNFTIIIDTIYPTLNTSGIESYLNLNNETDYNLSWEILASDPNLDSCWYWTSDNATAITVPCNTTITTTLTGPGNKTIHYCANDTIDNLLCGSSIITATTLSWETNESNSIVVSGDSTTFYIYVNMTDIGVNWQQTNATLNIEGSIYTPSKATTTNLITFYYTKTWVLTEGNITGKENYFNWSVYVKNSTYILHNLTTAEKNITVYALALDNCSIYTEQILNYSIYDETTKLSSSLANQSIELDMTITSGGISWSFNMTSNESLAVCVPTGSLNTSTEAYLDGIVKYSADKHVVEYNYLDNYKISTEYPIAIKLYTLNTDTANDEYSTSYIVRYADKNYLPVDGAIIDLLRYYVGEGQYLSVEHAKTDDEGETRLHLVSEDIIYKLIIRLDNTIIFQSSEFYALCKTTPCQMDFAEEGTFNQIGNYTQSDNINYILSLNEDTRTVTSDFSTRDGTERTLGLNVIKFDAYENLTVCENYLSASSGIITCVVPYSAKNTTYLVSFYDNTTAITEWIASGWFNLDNTPEQIFGSTGIIMSAFLILSIVLMALPSGAIPTIIGALVGVISATLLHLYTSGSIIGTGSAIMWLFIASGIIIWKASRRQY